MSELDKQVGLNHIYGSFLAVKDQVKHGEISEADGVAACEQIIGKLDDMKERTESLEADRPSVYQAPLDALIRKTLYSGMSLELSGFVWSCVIGILNWGEPLPADEKKAGIRVGCMSVKKYRRLVSEGVAAGILVILESGEVTSTIHQMFKPARARRLSTLREPRPAIPQDIRLAVLAKSGGVCAYCGVELTLIQGLPTSYQPDHLYPVSKGGTDDIGNLVPSCACCNGKKSAKTALQFMSRNDSHGSDA